MMQKEKSLMSRCTRSVGLILTAATVLSPLVGCEDEQAAERAAIQEKILEASLDLQESVLGAPAPGTEEYEQSIQSLTSLISQINDIRGGESGQQSARSLLLADVHSQLATLILARTDQLEDMNTATRIEISAIARRSTDLHHRIVSIESLDLTTSRLDLDVSQDLIRTELEEIEEQIGELQGPIDDRIQRNRQDAEEVEQLRLQSSALMREARESGYAGGFDVFEQAIQSQRRADRIEYEIAQRELELDLNLQAEHNFLSLNQQNARNASAAIDTARTALETFEQQGRSDNSLSRQTLVALRGQLDVLLAELSARSNDELIPTYQNAQDNLEKVAREAQASANKAGRDGAGAARMIAARANETLGNMHLTRARGINASMNAYELINDAREALGMDNAAQDESSRLMAAHVEAIQTAKTALAQALSLLGQVSGGNQSQLNSYKQSLQTLVESIGGGSSEASTEAASSGDDETTPPVDDSMND